MKHALKVTLLLLLLFFAAQLLGLVIISQYIDVSASAASGETVLYDDQYFIEPPQVQEESLSFIWIILLVLAGTGIVLLLIRFRRKRIWKSWFLLSVVITLSMAFFPFIESFIESFIPGIVDHALNITLLIALGLAIWKVFKPNFYIHNITELFIYGGLASLLVPIINLFSAFLLLILISFYDIYAVRQSKHMVKMAEFQTEAKVFAGLFIPYSSEKGKTKLVVPKPSKGKAEKPLKGTTAVLGGGDIAFPLLFTGALLKMTGSYYDALIVVVATTIALGWLLFASQKGKFYPAMPAIAAGCFVGYGITYLL